MSQDFGIDDLLSGRRRGFVAAATRTALRCAEPVYACVVWLRNWMFDIGLRKKHPAPVPVISVGNLTVGGTGKTPLVRWVTHSLVQHSVRPGIVSRGYGTRAGEANDEFLELEFYLPDVPHVQNPDRVAAACQAFDRHQVDAIVLDDGFQHRRLARDLDIVLIDASRPFGYDHQIPRGLLREGVSSLQRADFVVITRVDQVSADQVGRIVKRVGEYIDVNRIARVSFRACGWIDVDGNRHPLESVAGKSVVGFCGIGNPTSFRDTLGRLCNHLADFRTFADHFDYSSDEVNGLIEMANAHSAQVIVCTQKDLVKIQRLDCQDAIASSSIRLLALQLDVVFDAGETELLEQIRSVLKRTSNRR